MWRPVLIFGLLLLTAAPALAQSDCRGGAPCGQVPWRLPVLPRLLSPTPVPTQQPVESGSFSGNPGGTPTPAPTSFFSSEAMDVRISTLAAVMQATPGGMINPDGSYNPNGVADTVNQLGVVGSEGSIFVSYALAFYNANIGIFTPLLTFMILRVMVMTAVKLNVWLAPVAVAIFGFIRKVISLILDFLPL